MFKRMKEDIAVVFERDPAARTTLEVVFTSPGLHAIWLYRLSHFLWHKRLKFIARFLSHMTRFFTGVEIHPQALIGRRFFIDHGMGIVIGATAVIGDDCSLYHGVTLGGTKPYASKAGDKRHPTLENDVVIGSGAHILGPITLGAHSRIGSGSVVIHDVPEGATVASIPAQILKVEGTDVQTTQYGVAPDACDPLIEAINELETRVTQLEDDSVSNTDGHK